MSCGVFEASFWRRVRKAGHAGRRWAVFGGLVVLCCVAVTGRRVWMWASSPREAVEVAEALGRVSILQKPPLVDESGDWAGLVCTTDRGVEIAVVDLRNGRSQRLAETPDGQYHANLTQLLGWRSNGPELSYCMGGILEVWNTEWGHLRGLNPAGKPVGMHWMEGRGWLLVTTEGRLQVHSLEPGAARDRREWFLPVQAGEVRAFRVTGRDRIAWADTTTLWEGDLSTEQWRPLWRDDRGQIGALDHDPVRDLYLVTYSYRTNRMTVGQLVAVRGTLAVGGEQSRVLVQEESVLDGYWLHGSEGWAYRSVRNNRPRAIVRTGWWGGAPRVLEMDAVYALSAAQQGRVLFLHGSISNEPPGLWRYEVVADRLTCAWSPMEPGVDLPPLQPVLSGRAPWGAGHWATFDLLPPADYRRGRKYPLVIGPGTYEWTPIAHAISAQTLARAGAYVALVKYRWNQSQIETIHDHTNHVLAVERLMREHPSVDGDRVYLFGFSAGTAVVSKLAEMYPGRYRGIMLFNPVDFPGPRPGLTRRVLATYGEEEALGAWFERQQGEFCRAGIPLEWHVHPQGGHVIRARASLRERALWTLDFVFGR